MPNSSVGIESRDATFPAENVIGSIYPASSTLFGLNFMGGSLASSKMNLRNGDVDLTLVGTGPTINPLDVISIAANCLDTGLIVPGDFTYAVVAKQIATTAAMMLGNFSAAEGKGDGLAYVPATPVIRGYVGVGASPSISTTGLTLGRHRLIILRGSTTTADLSVYNDAATPVALTNSVAVSTRNASVNSVRVGASRDTGAAFGPTTSQSQIAFWGIWNSRLTDAQIENELRPFLAASLDASLAAAV